MMRFVLLGFVLAAAGCAALCSPLPVPYLCPSTTTTTMPPMAPGSPS